MEYIIATLESDNLILSINNHYTVSLYNKDTKQFTHKKSKSIDLGFKSFNLVSESLIKSLFTESDKRELLNISGMITTLEDFKIYLRALDEAQTIDNDDLSAAANYFDNLKAI